MKNKVNEIEPIAVRQLQHSALEYLDRVDAGEDIYVIRTSRPVRFYKISAVKMKGIIG